jgi:Leucine-rich repeat (LRR) protein
MLKVSAYLIPMALGLFLFSAPRGSTTEGKTLEISEDNATLLNHIGDYSDLEVLSIRCIEILRVLPDSIGKLTRLKELRMDNDKECAMNPVLPESIGHLHSLERLILFGAQDTRNPGLQPMERHKFPRGMSQLRNLVYLDLGRNGLDQIPVFVKDLPKLKELRFEYNNLKEMPSFISNLSELKTLVLNGNDLNDLPDFLATLPRLTQISIGRNCAITQNEARMNNLERRFPKVAFDFTDEYDCPEK